MKRFATPAWIALLAFVLLFVSFFLALGSFEAYLARRELSSQAGMMLRGFREGYESARSDLEKLPPIEELNCQNEISNLLARLTFDDLYVRWFGVARNGNVICRAGRVGISLSHSKSHDIDSVWSLLSVHGPGKTDNLLVVQRRGDTLYLALLEPLLFDFLHSVQCRACTSFDFMVKSDPEVILKSDETSDPIVISYTVEGERLGTSMKFTLNATQQYVDGFAGRGRLLSTIIASMIAAVFAFALYAYLIRRMSLKFLIEEGLRHREFLPYYQPIIDSRDGSVQGAEALVRWVTKRGKLIPPIQFIPYAEANYLIEPITEGLIDRIVVDMKRLGWQDTSRFISINAIAEQITDTPFGEKLIGKLSDNKISPTNLAVEITERHQFPDLERGRVALQQLVNVGIKIKLDDAGTGFGGFAYVQELPIQTLKIDKLFIDTLRNEGGDPKRKVLFAIIEFAKTAGLNMIAEGVEIQDQVVRLRDAGVYAIQGYVYARPMPIQEFIQWLQAR